jgi:hypothetical protein
VKLPATVVITSVTLSRSRSRSQRWTVTKASCRFILEERDRGPPAPRPQARCQGLPVLNSSPEVQLELVLRQRCRKSNPQEVALVGMPAEFVGAISPWTKVEMFIEMVLPAK